MHCAGHFFSEEGWGCLELGDADIAHTATTKCIKALLERSVIVSEGSLRGSCHIWFLPFQGHSLIEGNSKNSDNPEVYYFEVYNITVYYMHLLLILSTSL